MTHPEIKGSSGEPRISPTLRARNQPTLFTGRLCVLDHKFTRSVRARSIRATCTDCGCFAPRVEVSVADSLSLGLMMLFLPDITH